jgi:hypothetical protein
MSAIVPTIMRLVGGAPVVILSSRYDCERERPGGWCADYAANRAAIWRALRIIPTL